MNVWNSLCKKYITGCYVCVCFIVGNRSTWLNHLSNSDLKVCLHQELRFDSWIEWVHFGAVLYISFCLQIGFWSHLLPNICKVINNTLNEVTISWSHNSQVFLSWVLSHLVWKFTAARGNEEILVSWDLSVLVYGVYCLDTISSLMEIWGNSVWKPSLGFLRNYCFWVHIFLFRHKL